MKEQALTIVQGVSDPGQARNQLREYLQAFVLRSLHESEAFRSLAFVGGTALRFLHNLARFSEGLDFSLVSAADYAGRDWMVKLKRDLAFAGFDPEVAWNDRKVVHTGWVRVAGLLHEAGLSAHRDEKLSIRVEIDTQPPAGANCEKRVVTRHLTFFVQHYDTASLMAGKLNAILTRPYVKGRDWYDLVWYLSQRPPVAPNLVLLQNALEQMPGVVRGGAGAWREIVRGRLAELNFDDVRNDIAPFLERPQDAELLSRGNLEMLLGE